MPDSLLITPASWRDLNAVRQLEQVSFPLDAWPILDLISALTLPGVVRLKAVVGGRLVGLVIGDIRQAEDVSWIATIAVLPEQRGQGIGEQLLLACEQQLPTSAIRLCVRKANEVAIRLYRRNGYEYVSLWNHYYQDGEDALVMEKTRHFGL